MAAPAPPPANLAPVQAPLGPSRGKRSLPAVGSMLGWINRKVRSRAPGLARNLSDPPPCPAAAASPSSAGATASAPSFRAAGIRSGYATLSNLTLGCAWCVPGEQGCLPTESLPRRSNGPHRQHPTRRDSHHRPPALCSSIPACSQELGADLDIDDLDSHGMAGMLRSASPWTAFWYEVGAQRNACTGRGACALVCRRWRRAAWPCTSHSGFGCD